jgi:ABC-type glycerol-3-phosphate transport system substrate-binding protein
MFEELMTRFNQENADVRVQFVDFDSLQQSGESYDANEHLRRSVSAADTMISWGESPDSVKNGYLRDLAPLIDADTGFNRDDFFPGALEASSDGTIAMVPATMQLPLLAYNRDLFAARGLESPKPGWTWADVLSAATQISQKRGDEIEVYGLMMSRRSEVLRNGELNGIGDVLETSNPDTIRLDDPQIMAAAERAAQLINDGVIYTSPESSGSFLNSSDFMPLITGQKIGIWQAGWETWGGPGQLPFAMGIATYPPASAFDRSIFKRGYAMSAGTQHPEAAWRWLSFLSQQELNDTMGQDTLSTIPARRSVAESSGYWSKLDEEAQAAVRATLERLTQPPPADSNSPRFNQKTWMIYDVLGEALGAMLDNDQPAETALREAQTKLETRFAEAALTPTPAAATAAGPIVVATPMPQVAAAADAKKITFVTVSGDDSAIRKAANTFNQQFPQYFVEIKSYQTSGPLNLADVAAEGDCFTWWSMPNTAEDRARLLDLQPLMDADATFQRDDYPDALLARFQHEGALYGLPHDLNFRTLNYNKDVFDAAGIDYPNASWTMEDFSKVAEQLTTGSGDTRQYGFVVLGGGSLFFFLSRAGVSPISGSGTEARPNYTDPKVLSTLQSALELLRNTSAGESLSGYARDQQDMSVYDLVESGRAAMWQTYGVHFGENNPNRSFKLGVAPIPLGNGTLADGDFYTSALMISANAAHPDACWAWFQALNADPSSFSYSFPARISVAESEQFRNTISPDAVETYTAYKTALARNETTIDMFPPDYDYFWFFRAADRAFQGKDLSQEMTEAQAITEQYLDCVRAGGKPGTCARQVDSTYNGWAEE